MKGSPEKMGIVKTSISTPTLGDLVMKSKGKRKNKGPGSYYRKSRRCSSTIGKIGCAHTTSYTPIDDYRVWSDFDFIGIFSRYV